MNIHLTLLQFFLNYLLPLLIAFQSAYNYYWDYISTSLAEDCTAEVYDFIVVGGGSAGAVLANRLSLNNKVLLLEAGGTPLPWNSVPGFAPWMLNRPETDWMIKTVPQKNSQYGMYEQRSRWPRGKILGGSSNLNYMFYVRGHPLDYDLWSNITGDKDWSYESILPYFKKSANYHGEHANDKHYGQSPYGYLNIESRDFRPMHKYFAAAGKELGYEELDLNGPQREGLATIEVTQKKGERYGTYSAFLKDFMHRENLVVSKYSHATKIKLDKNNRAVGVWFEKHGEIKLAKASKEIIVSAGAIGSPQLLMLSGIGPSKHLKDVGVKTRVDLPVGQNLKDHFATIISPFFVNDSVTLMLDRDLNHQTFTDYIFHGKGVFTCPTGCHSHAFVQTTLAKKEGKKWPDLQLYLSAGGLYSGLTDDFSALSNIRTDLLEKYFTPDLLPKNSFFFLVNLARVKSVGEIKLANKDPKSTPVIDPRYLENPHDLKVIVEGIKIVMKMAEETNTFKTIDAKFGEKHFPGCEQHALKSDAYYECYVRHLGMTLYHHCGTCSMGPANDKKTVVDSKLRVLKTIGLRVADASVMPEIPNGNINAPVIMIAEKAADLIRSYWVEQYAVCNTLERLHPKKYANKCYYTKLT